MVNEVERRALRMGPAREQGMAVVVSRRAVDRLSGGAVWVYRSEVEQVLPAADLTTEGMIHGGAVLATVLDGGGVAYGSALFSSTSEITLRLVSRLPGLTRADYLAEVAGRVHAALDLREELAPGSASGGSASGGSASGGSASDNACRLIFAEADELPGIVVDRYNDLVIVQLLTQGTAENDVREVLTGVLRERLSGVGLATICERPDPRVRALEGLPFVGGEALYADREEAKLTTVFTLNGLRFAFDAQAGQKTGAFLDQRLNYAAAARAASSPAGRGAALDVCTYQGGFALHLARVCERVTGVDASRAALEVADANLELNPELGAKVDWVEADAFDLLREYEATGRRYGTIVLDPPAFAKSKRATEGALRGYKELNLRALKMLEPGGALVTCSCSHHVDMEEFLGVVAAAAVDARRRVQVVEARGAAPDHPAILGLAETNYLKCLICRVG